MDALEELGDDDRVAIALGLGANRTTGVLDVIQSSDAADLVSELPGAQVQAFLSLVGLEEAKDVRRLLSYAESTTGSFVTTDPVIFGPDAMVAQILVSVRREDLPTPLATVALIMRPPEEIPAGPYLGMIHTQRALCEPPQTLLGMILDPDIEAASPQIHIATVTHLLVTYSLTILPVVDEDSHLLGAVSVDSLFDELLPGDWRDYDGKVIDRIMMGSIDG